MEPISEKNLLESVEKAAFEGAKAGGVSCRECELVEDDFSTLLDVMGDGVKTTHISQLINNCIRHDDVNE